jgi:murein DD-endopeptidase MepM/ murein hydrolase activator NlpD
VIKSNLIVLILLCAGALRSVPAQSDFMVNEADKVTVNRASSGLTDPGRKRKNKKIIDPVEPTTKKNFTLTPVTVPEYPVKFTRDKYELPSYFSVDGEYKLDCLYLNSHQYFSVWENNKLNPYGVNGEYFSDTVQLILFNHKDSILWHSPLDQTIITSDFGLRRATWHYGVDLRLKVGVPVYSAFNGVVRVIGYERRGFGRYLVIRHSNGLESVYAHLSKTFVNLGDVVHAGDVIGNGGNSGRSTAPHLHFELRYAGNAIDPNLVYDFKTNQIRDRDFLVDPEVFTYLAEANKIRYHTVRSGDTLSGIGYRYGVSITKLCRLNGIRRTSILNIGQRIRIN